MVLSIVERDGVLLVGTGSDGLVYQVNPAAEETVVLAKVDSKQVMSMLPTRKGRLVLGLANAGGIASMSSGYASEGTYTSPVLDAMQISRFGKIRLQGSLPADTAMTLATRSGNLRQPGEQGWSKWSPEQPVAEYVASASPPARYFQYRVTFSSKDGKNTPLVDEVDVAYQMPNLAPQIRSIKIGGGPAEGEGAGRPPMMGGPAAMPPMGGGPGGAAKEPASGRIRQITWEAVDPNGDAMEYTLYFQNGSKGPWIQLANKLKDPQYSWDTKGVADGHYRIKVTASDAKANPRGEGKTTSRLSDPIVVNNTPPVIGDVKVTVQGQTVKIEAKLVDRTSIVASCDYAVDSKDDWQAVPSLSTIWDSPEEGVAFSIDELKAGPHQITLRAADAYGNQAYETVNVTIGPDAGK